MVLTTLLLILAIFALDWQENANLKMIISAVEPQEEVVPISRAANTNCCLQHALQATEKSKYNPLPMAQALQSNLLLLAKHDSANHLAVTHL